MLPAQIPIGRETKDPIHLTLDTTLASGRVTMKAYVSAPLGVPGATSGSMFSPVQVELVAAEPEVAGLDLLYKTKYSKVGYARFKEIILSVQVRTVEPMPELSKVSEAGGRVQVTFWATVEQLEL